MIAQDFFEIAEFSGSATDLKECAAGAAYGNAG